MANFDFSTYFKKSSDSLTDASNRSQLYEIKQCNELLQETSINAILKDIQKQLCVTKEVFDTIYLKVINNYAEFVQSLPNIKFKNFDTLKGQLILSLIRASITLETSEQYPIPESKDHNTNQERREAIWRFAIFSSSLLLDIGKALNRFNIATCLENKSGTEPWFALGGSMVDNHSNNTHYYYEPLDLKLDEQYKSLTNKLNLLYSRLIIPDFILEWLYSEKDIFMEWLSILEDEVSGSGTLHTMTIKSIRELLNEYMGIKLPDSLLEYIPHHIDKKQEYHKNSFWKGVEHALRGKYGKNEGSFEGTNLGQEFLHWLQKGLEKKQIKTNTSDANVHISKEGVFLMTPEVFKEFCKSTGSTANWLTVFKQFNQLGVSSFSRSHSLSQAYFPNIDKNYLKNGIIVKDTATLFKNIKSPNVSPEIVSDPERKIQNSSIFPSPREESGAFLRHAFKPKSE